jgi:anti-anti-sigma factor
VDLTCRFTGDVAILDLTGRFVVTAGETEIPPLRSAVRKLIAEGRILLALNLKGLVSIDARGLGELACTLKTLRRCGGELILIAPTAVVRRMLSVTRLDQVFPSCDSEVEAARRLQRTVPSLENRSFAG